MSVSDLCRTAVTLRKFTYSNVQGQRTRSATSNTSTVASVQPRSVSRDTAHGAAESVTEYVVYFASDPTLAVDDQVIWGTRVLVVKAPAMNAAAQSKVWRVDCTLRTGVGES